MNEQFIKITEKEGEEPKVQIQSTTYINELAMISCLIEEIAKKRGIHPVSIATVILSGIERYNPIPTPAETLEGALKNFGAKFAAIDINDKTPEEITEEIADQIKKFTQAEIDQSLEDNRKHFTQVEVEQE